MANVTLPKAEYEKLKRQAETYRRFAARFFELALRDPVRDVVRDFRRTNLYTEKFLNDLESGLRKSSYAKRYGTRAAKRRS